MTPPTQALARPVVRRLSHDPAEPSADRRPESRAHRDPVTSTSSRVLVLDTDGERQWALSDAVHRAGGEAIVARSGAEAVKLLAQDADELPALLVGGLPDGSRRGFVAWARPRLPDLAIVAIADDAGEATALYNAGADIVTTAPLDPDLLGAKLGAALRRARRPSAGGHAHAAPVEGRARKPVEGRARKPTA